MSLSVPTEAQYQWAALPSGREAHSLDLGSIEGWLIYSLAKSLQMVCILLPVFPIPANSLSLALPRRAPCLGSCSLLLGLPPCRGSFHQLLFLR